MSEATWIVPVDHPAFAGHFPGRPIVPGVVLLDRLLVLVGRPCGIASAKFLSPVGPGEALEYSWQENAMGGIQFAISAAGRRIATGLLTVSS